MMAQENELVELDFCCPECHCSQWQCIENETYTCARCYYFCEFSFDTRDHESEPSTTEPLTEILAAIEQGCPHCQSSEIEYDCLLGNFKCFDCDRTWQPKINLLPSNKGGNRFIIT